MKPNLMNNFYYILLFIPDKQNPRERWKRGFVLESTEMLSVNIKTNRLNLDVLNNFRNSKSSSTICLSLFMVITDSGIINKR